MNQNCSTLLVLSFFYLLSPRSQFIPTIYPNFRIKFIKIQSPKFLFMRLSVIASILFIGIILSSWSFDENWKDKVDDSLLIKLMENNGAEYSCILMFENQANLTTAKSFSTKTEKGQFVFDELKRVAAISQNNVIELLENLEIPFQSFYLVNAIELKANREMIEVLASRSDIFHIADNPAVKMDRVMEAPQQLAPEWGISNIQADSVWAMGYRGQGVVVGGQDTGYEWTHPAIVNTYRGWDGSSADHDYNWHDAIHEINPLHGDSVPDPSLNPCGLDVAFPCDDHNHGTHTMGTMVGSDLANGIEIGVAPEAKWIACRNMERGYGMPSTYIECFEWFLAPYDIAGNNPDPSKAPHVINNSWSCPEMEGCNPSNWAMMETAVNNLKASGVVVVVSAGNSGGQGCGSVQTPSAMFEGSFSIGAIHQNDTIANFSSRGPVTIDNSFLLKPNVAAPGVGVLSCIRDSMYASFSGTSMAAPHVVGLVALLISANPELAGQVDAIEDIIEATAIPMLDDMTCGEFPGDQVPNAVYGYGRVNALAAVNQALQYSSIIDIDPNVRVVFYPNPFKDNLSVALFNFTGNTTFKLYDAAGKLMQQQEWNLMGDETREIDVNGLPKGVYFYQVSNGANTHEGKVMRF